MNTKAQEESVATIVRKALEDALVAGVEGAITAFDRRMEGTFSEGFTELPGEIRSRLERINGALSAARDYVKEQARGIR